MFADIAPRVGGVFLNQQDRTLAAEKANPLCTGDFLRSWHPGKVVDLLLADILVCTMATESVPCPASSPFSMASNSQTSVRTSRICCLDTKGLLEPNRATTDLTRSRACRLPQSRQLGRDPLFTELLSSQRTSRLGSGLICGCRRRGWLQANTSSCKR